MLWLMLTHTLFTHISTHTHTYIHTHTHRNDFAINKLTSLITVSHRNVTAQGFPSIFQHPSHNHTTTHTHHTHTNTHTHTTHTHTHTHIHTHKLVHAVSLDLPNPWVVIKFAADILCVNGMLASFSPCIEQVQK